MDGLGEEGNSRITLLTSECPRWGGFQIWKAGKPERPDFFLFSRFQHSKQDTAPDAAGLTVPGVLAI
jgi:hypothetical protein